MNIREFTAFAAEEILNYLPQDARGDVVVRPTEVMKINDQILFGLSFCTGEDPAPTYYLNDLFDLYSRGAAEEDLLRDLADLYEEQKMSAPRPAEIPDMSFSKVKRRAALRLLGMDYNREYLKSVPFRDAGSGYALICEANIKASDGGVFSTVITNKIAEDNDYNMDALFQSAMDNAWKENAASLLPAGEIVGESEWDREPDSCYVLTTNRQRFGATALFYPGTQAMIEHVLGEDYFALPSSLHEFIILRKSRVKDPAGLVEMVREANRIIVAPEEVLSDNVLYYSKTSRSLSLFDPGEAKRAACAS